MTLETGAAFLALEQAGTDQAGLAARLSRLRELTEGALAEMRALIFELRPDAIREEGLVAAIRKHAAGIAAREELKVLVQVRDEVALPPAVEEQLYRLAQEALSNATRHSRAQSVRIRLGSEGERVVLEIEDDGIGFDPSRPRPGHLGMRSMLQRAQALGGTLEVASQPGAGTCVRASVPLRSEAAWQQT